MQHNSRNYDRPEVSALWAETRETHIAVATAIHAIADTRRSPEDIWEVPTSAEWDHVEMAVKEYLDHGDFQPEVNGRYPWGGETITIALAPL